MILFYENIRLALYSIKANKMRSLLTMLGIIIGIASVIAIMTVGNSLTNTLTDTMSSMGASNIMVGLQQKTVEAEESEDGMSFGEDGHMREITEDDLFSKEMIDNFCETYADSVVAISASENLGAGQILDKKKYANINGRGVSIGYFLEEEKEMLTGRYFTKREMDDAAKVAIISDYAVDNMFEGDNEEAIGSIIQVRFGEKYYNFTVVGVYKYEASDYGFSMTSQKDTTTTFYMPLRTVKDITHTKGYQSFTVLIAPEVDPDTFADTVAQFFATYYRTNDCLEPMAFSMASMVEMVADMMNTITTAISVIAGIALLVGGIGVMNIMLVSITERTREIGTRKALGAPNSSIRLQFIVEAIVICLVGGIIGIILGVLMGVGMANLLEAPASPSISSIIMSLTFSMAIGVFFGYYPANKAAKMDPIEALRYE